MRKTISKDTPLSELTLRKYEKPENLSDRNLVRKLCLSLGLLQPGDSRDVMVDVFYALLIAKKEGNSLSSKEIEEKARTIRVANSLPLNGLASSNIRRQIKRLKDLFLIDCKASSYRITELSPTVEIFEEKIERYFLPSILNRTKEYLKEIDRRF
ncbi:MAG TPA: hypothetical protein VJI46_01505 [Candidatus Nanoarchaeia archaeon]|nr:hypothetical protein [Candidatus Nanoarchaeia archaeon]